MNHTERDNELAKRDPATEFGTPEAVLADTTLDEGQKIAVLRSWEYDAVEQSVAEEEGMSSDTPSMLQRVQKALETLTGGEEGNQTGPTKHGAFGGEPVKKA